MVMVTRTAPDFAAAAFAPRHNAPTPAEQQVMLDTLGYPTLEAFIDAVVPETIRFRGQLRARAARSEAEVLADLKAIASRNAIWRSYLGMGYADTITPPVILRNIMENPAWYTAYTPYQAEIAQGRLEALLNFQTMVADLTGLEIANASLLDEGTAAAESMAMALAVRGGPGRTTFFIAHDCHPQTIAVVRARAEARGVTVIVGDALTAEFDASVFGVLLQYPATDGAVYDYRAACERAHAVNALVTVATDLLSLALLTPPGEWGADVAVGNSQRFGVPMGYGGPHAAFFATRDEFKRQLPGRIIGVSRDADGRPALRMALQTREQHIRREKATSNVCTAQVLLAVMAGMYAVYHGPDGVRRIAERVHGLTVVLAAGLERLGLHITHDQYFDTLRVTWVRTGRRTFWLPPRRVASTCAYSKRERSASPSTRPSPPPMWPICGPCSTRARTRISPSRRSPMTSTRASTSASLAPRRISRIRCSRATTARRRCCATCTRCRPGTSRLSMA
jgi:glycine dehydrogenase